MRVLMCRPKYFDVPLEDPEKNPWMNTLRLPDHERALIQWTELRDFYTKHGVTAECVEPVDASSHFQRLALEHGLTQQVEGLFDQVFAANTAFGIGEKWVIGNLAPWWRKYESAYVAEFLVRERKSVHFLPEHIIFEGQGDLVRIGSREYCYCYGIRNARHARWWLENMFPTITTIPMRLIDPRWYHGDTCLRYLEWCNTILWIPQAFDRKSRKRLVDYTQRARINLLAAPKRLWFQETKCGINFPMHGLGVNNIETFPWDERVSKFPQKIREYIETRGGTVWLHNFDQFGLSGAGHRCVTLFLD